MKPVAQLDVDLSRFGKVCSTERIGAVQQKSLVGQIYCLQGYLPVFAEAFANRKVKRRVVRKMIRSIAIEKTRAVTYVCGNVGARRQIDGKARAQRMALIVIEEEQVFRRREVSESAGHSTKPLQALARVSQI